MNQAKYVKLPTKKKKNSEKNNNKTDKRERRYEVSDLRMKQQHHSMTEVECRVERGENRPKADPDRHDNYYVEIIINYNKILFVK